MTQSPLHGLRTLRLAGIIAGTALLAATVVILGSLTPGYSQLSDTISRLASGGQPRALLARSAFAVYGLLVIAGAGPLAEHVAHRRHSLARLIGAYGLAGLVAGMAPKDLPGAPHTLASQIHVTATIAGGAVILGAMVLAAIDAPRQIDRRVAGVVGGLTVVAAITLRFSWGSELYGLNERFLLAGPALWLVSLALRTLNSPHQEAVGALTFADLASADDESG